MIIPPKNSPKISPISTNLKPLRPSRAMWVEYFRYLDELRESGDTNMWGGSSYLKRAYDLDENTARKVLLTWMDYFDVDVDPMDRVDTMLAKEAA